MLHVSRYKRLLPCHTNEGTRIYEGEVPLSLIRHVKKNYNLDVLVTKDDCICIRIQKGMPRLKQAAILVHEHLKQCLLPYGYEPIHGTIRL